MKQFLAILVLILTSFSSFSQALGHNYLALQFSRDNQYGSARFTSMSGAFGAVGGDISSINVNPAGLGIFKYSESTMTFNIRNTTMASTYYGNSLSNTNDYFNISHTGAVLVYEEGGDEADWGKFAVGVSYRITNNFDEDFYAEGNSGFARFFNYPLDLATPLVAYNTAEKQQFSNSYSGNISELNLAFSAVHQNKLYLGLGVNFYELDFFQSARLREQNTDGNNNRLNANFYQENISKGCGFSLNLGAIYKLNKKFRVGLSYQTATWYSTILEVTNIVDNEGFKGDTRIEVSSDTDTFYDNTSGDYFPQTEFSYRLSTPEKITASGVYVFGKKGLISLDYVFRNYKKISLSNADFSTQNSFFQNDLRATHSFNLGTEWRFGNLSFRGGYRFVQSPDKFAIFSGNLKGYSLGTGYNFGGAKLDISFSDNNQTDFYNFYPQSESVNSAELKRSNKIFALTLTYNL